MSNPNDFDPTPEYDESPLERRVKQMSVSEAKRALKATLMEWAAVDEAVREIAEDVLGEDWLERDENGAPSIEDIVKRLVEEVREARS